MKMKVLHLITSLDIGGANMMLYKLLAGASRDHFSLDVLVMADLGKLGPRIEALDIPVTPLGMPLGNAKPEHLIKIRRYIQKQQPDLIQAWGYHANVAASLQGLFDKQPRVLWNIRHTPYDMKAYKRLTYLLIRYGGLLSRQPAKIIYNSQTSLNRHQALGYASDKAVVIANGFDLGKFKPSPAARLALRQELGLGDTATIIGMVARFHPMKDHANFLKAASQLKQDYPQVHFVLVGTEVDNQNAGLVQIIKALNLEEHVHLLGERSDIASINAGLDIACLSSSWGDAFPNVIGEAMACEVPCVVTNIGDSALMVSDTGVVVPPRDSDALKNAWEKLLKLPANDRLELGRAARRRVLANYSLPAIVQEYETLYHHLQPSSFLKNTEASS